MWLLLGFLLLVWLLWLAASMSEVALSEAKKGVPEGERRGVSILPGFPLFPIVFWGIALLIDAFADPWGTYMVAGIHVVLGARWGASTVRDTRALARLEDTT